MKALEAWKGNFEKQEARDKESAEREMMKGMISFNESLRKQRSGTVMSNAMELSLDLVRKVRSTLKPLIEAEKLFDEGMRFFELGKTQDPTLFEKAVECIEAGARLFVKHQKTAYSKEWNKRICDLVAAKETICWIQRADWSLHYQN